MVLNVLIILLIPLILLLALAFVRQPSRTLFYLYLLAMGLAIAFMWLVFPWDVISVWYRRAVPLLLIVAVYYGFRRIRQPDKPVAVWQTILNVSINVILIVFMGGLTGWALKGYQQPAGSIDLASPLRDGSFVVGHGGSSPFINAHAKVRPQNFALDIIGLNHWGSRRTPFSDPAVLENYAIFNAPLYAPCDGRVVLAVDGLDDLIPPATDRKNLAGNHVVISCHDAEIVLAHMKKGSVQVESGQRVNTDTVLGLVGNSGNTSEPHLHMHAERGGEGAEQILNGVGVPITIEGRYLVRGSTF